MVRGKYYPDTKTKQRHHKKQNYRPISLRDRDAKILKETLENPVQKHIKRTAHHDKMGFIPRMQSCLNIQELVNIKHHIKK